MPDGDTMPFGEHALAVRWESSRLNLPQGTVPADGGVYDRATYPDAWALINAGKVPVVDDSVWLADPTQRGKYSRGDGSTTFRLPDFNGKHAGSLGAVFQRGDGAKSAAEAGLIQLDAFQGHEFELPNDIIVGGVGTAYAGGGYGATASGRTTVGPVSDNTNGTPRVAAETRPLSVTGCWAIRLYGAINNPGAVDITALANEVNSLGTAAKLTAQATVEDYTPGRALFVGGLGFGASYSLTSGLQYATDSTGQNADALGFWRYTEGATVGVPTGAGYGAMMNIPAISSGGKNYGSQLFFDYSTDTIVFRRLFETWQPPVKFLHTGNQFALGATAQSARANLTASSVVTVSASRALVIGDAGQYLRTTAAVTVTVPTDASVAFPIGTEITIRAAQASGNTTTAAASGVTLVAPADGTLVLGPRMTVTLKKAGTDTWDVIGQTVPA